MQPRDAFGIIVRTLGLVCLLYGGHELLTWFAFEAGWRGTLEHGVKMRGLFYSAIGIIAIRAADAVVWIAYPARRR